MFVLGVGSYRGLRLLAALVTILISSHAASPASATAADPLEEAARAVSKAACVEESEDGLLIVPCETSAGARSSASLATCPAYGYEWLGTVELNCNPVYGKLAGPCSVTAQISPAQPEGTVYVVTVGTATDMCATASESTSTSTSLTHYFTGLPANRHYRVKATASGCPTPNGYRTVDSLTTAPAGGTLTLQASGSASVLVTMSIPDSLGTTMIQRAPIGGAFTDVFVGFEYVYCTGTRTYTDSPVPAGTFRYRLRRTGGQGVSRAVAYSPEATVTVGSTCPTPGAPTFPVSSASLASGQSYAASWSRPTGLTDGTYVLDTSRSSGFTTLESSQTLGVAAGVITPAASATDYQLYARVKAVATCGSVGPYSLPLTLTVRAGVASFVVTQVAPFPTTARGSAAPSASIAFRNVGAQSGRLSFSSVGGWFTVSPTNLDLGPGASGAVTLVAAGAVAQSGSYSGALRASSTSQVLETPVTLTVTPVSTPDGSRAGMKAKASATTLVFSAPEGQNPASQTLTIRLSQVVGSGPVYLVPTIGPGGAWLRLSSELSSPVPAGGSVTLTVTVDRSRRTAADGAPPLRTLLQILPAGGQPPAGADTGDAAVIEIVDLVPPALAPGSGRSVFQGLGIGLESLEAPGTGADGLSFIVPVVVRAPGLAGATYLSDGWLRNMGSAAVPVELYYTPQDKDGLSDASVVKASMSVPASSTVRLSDLLGAYFQTTGTGQVEVRSPSPSALTLRTVVKSVTGDDPTLRFETEIPTLPLGSGVALDEGEAMTPGVSEDALQRTNLILAETTGRSVTAQITLYARDGTVAGRTTRQVPPYGKIQVNRVVNELAPGTSLVGGSVGVQAIAGAGRVASIVTVIDNRSNSFSAVRGRALRTTAARTGLAAATIAASPLAYVLPSAVRTTGINNTQYKTSLFLTNGTASVANLVLTYHYVDLDDGGNLKSAVKAWQIVPRGTLFPEYGEDVLLSLFGVSNRSYGWIEMTGEVEKVSNIYTEIRTQVDPTDPGRGVKKAAVSGYFSTDPVVIGKGATEHRFAGAEKTVQKRSNLALVETAGAPCDVKVRIYNPVAPGGVMAERTYSLRAKEYLAITDVFGPAGLQLGEGPFQNAEVTAEVINGNGRVVATVQVIDNEPRNPSIFVLSVPGPGDPVIGF